MDFFELEDPAFIKVDEEVTRCLVDDWQRRISIYNTEKSGTGSAADVASAQVRRSAGFVLWWVWCFAADHLHNSLHTRVIMRP